METIKAFIRKEYKKFLRFLGVGAFSTAFDIVIFSTLVHFLFPPAAAHALSYFLGLLFNFTAQRFIVFKGTRHTRDAFIIALFFWFIGWGVSTLFISGLTTSFLLLNTYPLGAKLIVTSIMLWYNFFSRRFAFKDYT